MPKWANQRFSQHPSKSLTTLTGESPENTSGLKLERANGLPGFTDQHKRGEMWEPVSDDLINGGRGWGKKGWQGQTAWQGSRTQLSQQQSSAKCITTHSRAEDHCILHAWFIANASLKTSEEEDISHVSVALEQTVKPPNKDLQNALKFSLKDFVVFFFVVYNKDLIFN